jgi:hypothetical protein
VLPLRVDCVERQLVSARRPFLEISFSFLNSRLGLRHGGLLHGVLSGLDGDPGSQFAGFFHGLVAGFRRVPGEQQQDKLRGLWELQQHGVGRSGGQVVAVRGADRDVLAQQLHLRVDVLVDLGAIRALQTRTAVGAGRNVLPYAKLKAGYLPNRTDPTARAAPSPRRSLLAPAGPG